MKNCNKCGISKSNDSFYDGRAVCKECISEEGKEFRKDNKKKVKESKRRYYLNNIEKIKLKNKRKREKEENKEKASKYHSEYRKKNLEKLKEYHKKYYKENREKIIEGVSEHRRSRKENDSLYRFICSIRRLVKNSINRGGFTKKNKTYKILGCSYEEFKLHIESKFEPWMNWENRGKYNGEFNYGWDIDHIIPISTSDTEDDVIRLNHYTNLQPLCSKINRDIKRNNKIK